ncbi:MAG: hypothetical protein ACOYOA_08895 [Saprospiraceae bacterium]
MKNLIEIASIVTKKKVRKIEIFDDSSLKNKSSKFNEFYEALLANKFTNDRDASLFLYNCQPTDDKYRQLKSRFRKRLLNTLFFLDVNTPSTSNYDRAYFSCKKEWSLVKILELNDAMNAAADQASQILTTALKFKFADIVVDCAGMLRRFAAENDLDKEYEQFDKLVKEYTAVREVEIKSEEYYQRTVMYYYNPISQNQEQLEKINDYCDELVSLSEIHDSPVVLYNMYLVWVYRFEINRDWEAMLEVCNRAESYVENNPVYYQENKVSTFQIKKMTAYLHLRDYKNGKVNAEKSLQRFEEGSAIWFTFLEYYVLLAIHTDNYLNALAIMNRAINQPKLKKLKTESRDKWVVYEAYLNFFTENPSTQTLASQASKRRVFKVAKFLTDQPHHSKEAKILTMHTMVAQILFHLKRKSFPAATEVIERLKLFSTRQLKPDEYFRTLQFVKMLQQLPKANYKTSDLSNIEKYQLRLQAEPYTYRGMIQEIEVLPYDKLWDIILKML